MALPGEHGDAKYRMHVDYVSRESEKAILCKRIGKPDLWVPKSQIDDDSEIWRSGQAQGWLIVTQWWAEQHPEVKWE